MRSVFYTICFVSMLAGCEAPAARPAPVASPAATLSPAAAALRERLTNTANGLEMRRWIVADRPERLVSALTAHVDGPSVDDQAVKRLRRNGFRFVRVPVDRLESLLADLGGASYDANEWHGQVHDWRSILDRPIQKSGCAVAVDGMVARYDRGEFRLMLRSWTVQLESGPFVHMELLPRYRVPNSQNLRRLLGNGEPVERGFGSLSLDVQLEAGFAYLLFGESPQANWPGVDPQDDFGESPPIDEPSSSGRSRAGGIDPLGPEAVAPPTLGELMLAPDRADATRAVLIFVPKVADALYLPEQAAIRPTNRSSAEGESGG